MLETTNEELIMLNPFNCTDVVVNKVIDENKKSADWFKDYIALNDPVIENEFYALFSDGLLVKKGRSKFLSSGYLKGEKFKSFKEVYNEKV
jgi:hypothetical protein